MDIVQLKEILAIRSHLHKLVDGGRMPHALLLSERASYGALQLAMDLASYLLDNDIKAQRLVHPDLHFLFPVNLSTQFKDVKRDKLVIDDFYKSFRELYASNPFFSENELYDALSLDGRMGNITVTECSNLMRKLSMTAFLGDVKVALILFPERINEVASNKLLKTLEEPTPGTYIIMITRSKERILPTILSRCSILEVPPAGTEEIASQLEKDYGVDASTALVLARKSAGSWGEARQLALNLKEEGAVDNEHRSIFLRLLQDGIRKDLVSMQAEWTAIASMNKEEQKAFCTCALDTLRSIYMIRQGMDDLSYVLPEHLSGLRLYAQNLKPEFYQKAYDFFTQAIVHINANVNAKFIFCDICNRIYHFA